MADDKHDGKVVHQTNTPQQAALREERKEGIPRKELYKFVYKDAGIEHRSHASLAFDDDILELEHSRYDKSHTVDFRMSFEPKDHSGRGHDDSFIIYSTAYHDTPDGTLYLQNDNGGKDGNEVNRYNFTNKTLINAFCTTMEEVLKKANLTPAEAKQLKKAQDMLIDAAAHGTVDVEAQKIAKAFTDAIPAKGGRG